MTRNNLVFLTNDHFQQQAGVESIHCYPLGSCPLHFQWSIGILPNDHLQHQWSGVRPELVLGFLSSTFSIINWHTGKWPFWPAQWSGVPWILVFNLFNDQLAYWQMTILWIFPFFPSLQQNAWFLTIPLWMRCVEQTNSICKLSESFHIGFTQSLAP